MAKVSRRNVFLAAPALCLCIARGGFADAATTGVVSARQAKIKSLAEGFLTSLRAPGLSVAYFAEGSPRYVAAFGKANPNTGEDMTPDHVSRIASASKPITAAAIMQLREAGKLALDSPVFGPNGILDKRFPIPDSAAHRDWLLEITVDHLLSHTGGGWFWGEGDPVWPHPEYDQDAMIRNAIANIALSYRAGRKANYSNFGFILLGRIIEVVTGESYETYVRRHLLEPAGASDMAIGRDSRGESLPREVAYVSQTDWAPYSLHLRRMDAAGGWVGSATSLAKVGLRLDGNKAVPDLIGKESVRIMQTPSAAADWYGHGWMIKRGSRARWHSGNFAGTNALLVLAGGGSCFAGFTNTSTTFPSDVEAFDRLMWAIYREVMG